VSGIVGIVHLNGAPVDERLLRRMTASLTYRGPDARQTWAHGPAGFGHALLKTTDAPRDQQPASLDGQVWITADARVDGRADLVEQLASRGRTGLEAATDCQLILHAYHVWGEGCVEHLLGDFALAIWDGRTRRLFCARDQFGIKPLYYARTRHGVVFSNTLDCVRLHPEVGDALDELAIGDFLLFGYNHEPTTTTFSQIKRVPPAHSLTFENGTARSKRYWSLPTDGSIRYRRSEQYVDHFRDVLRAAVSDRLRMNRIGVWMSGGLDSTSITAIAQQIRLERAAPFALRAHTIYYDSLIPDREHDYSRIAAGTLGVDVNFFAADEYAPFDGWDQEDLQTPEPTDDLFLLMRREQLRRAASHSRVMLCGEGGDEGLWTSYLVDLLGRSRPMELIAGIARSLVSHRRRPGIGFRSKVRSLRRGADVPPYPTWLNSTFTDRWELRARWAQWHAPEPAAGRPLRAEAHHRLTTAPWAWYFESFDPGVTRVPVEGRYPFLDIRVINFLLAIPPLPWCIDKELLRLTMLGALPDSVRLRRKTALAGDPLRARLQKPGVEQLDRFVATPELARYVNRTAIPQLAGGGASDPSLCARPLCLNHWLQRVRPATHLDKETCDDRQLD
jgi:asparagine synthase (glutamine-hydrolysing)